MTTLDRSHAPAPGPVRIAHFPDFARHRLANGLDILVCRRPRVPLVHLEVLTAAGGWCDPSGCAGLASLHGSLLDEGTTKRSTQEIADLVEGWGGSLSSGTDWDSGTVEIDLLSRHLDGALSLLAEVVRTPSFPADELERLRRRRLADILRRRDQPGSVAYQTLTRAIFGEQVYGSPLVGTERSLSTLQREDCLDLYRRVVTPSSSALIAVGDLDPDAFFDCAESAFADWQAPAAQLPELQEASSPKSTAVFLVDRPHATQTEIRVGHIGMSRRDPDYPIALVLNSILGGKFTSRINLNLRERHGLTYGAYSQFVFRRGAGPFVIRAAVTTAQAGKAVREVLAEVDRIRSAPASRSEIADSQDYLVGTFPNSLQTVRELSHRFEILSIFDLPDDYYVTYPACLREVTADEVLDVAQRRLHPEHLTITAAGPAESLAPQLEELGPVRIVNDPDDI